MLNGRSVQLERHTGLESQPRETGERVRISHLPLVCRHYNVRKAMGHQDGFCREVSGSIPDYEPMPFHQGIVGEG
jgi:hypothetical protein